jgi:hypothetical protein
VLAVFSLGREERGSKGDHAFACPTALCRNAKLSEVAVGMAVISAWALEQGEPHRLGPGRDDVSVDTAHAQ